LVTRPQHQNYETAFLKAAQRACMSYEEEDTCMECVSLYVFKNFD